jgi:hypothetical protein
LGPTDGRGPTTQFQVNGDGSVIANSFTGDGSMLTGVTAIDVSCGGCISASEVASDVQKRVSESCAVGSGIRQINADGTVECEFDDTLAVSDVLTASVTNGGVDLDGTITLTTESICFLTGVQMQDIDTSDEIGACRIVEFGTGNKIWQLQAIVSPSGKDGDVWCEATCFTH